MKIFTTLTLTLWTTMASAQYYIFYCDKAFSDKEVLQAAIDENGEFTREDASVQFKVEGSNDEIAYDLKIDGKRLMPPELGELEILSGAYGVQRIMGKGSKKSIENYKFLTRECSRQKATLEKSSVEDEDLGSTTLQCVCSVD